MATNIYDLKYRRNELIKVQSRLLDKADAAKRGLTDEEKAERKKREDQIEKLAQEILDAEIDMERSKKSADKEIAMRTRTDHSGDSSVHLADVNPETEFRNVGEFLHAIARLKRDFVNDPRLEILREKREQTMGTGATGGYALPEQFDPTLREVQAAVAAVRPRATVIPAGSPPDAKLTFPALDQTAAQNMYGGVQVVHTGEGVTMTETTAHLREVGLEPKEISAYIVVTDKLLNNWQAAGSFVSGSLARAVAGQEDYDFLRGDGVNKALGLLNSAACVVHARAGANAISFADCYNMMARLLMRGGSPVWLASPTIIPQLVTMVDAGNHSVWLGGPGGSLSGAQARMPGALLGYPIVFADRLPALGTKGDLVLADLSYYLIKDGSRGAASSEHVFFTSNKTVFRIVWNVDGHPWLTEPIPLEGSTSNTVSPFVILN